MMVKRRYSRKYYYRKARPKSRISLTLLLILINAAFFLITLSLLTVFGEKIIYSIALQPSSALIKPWTFITSMFMHGSFFHLFVNMVSLFFLGSFLEKLIGKKRFFTIYMITGIVGGLFFLLFSLSPLSSIPGIGISDPEMIAVGASGAIFGLGGVLAVLTPRVPVYLMFIPIAMPLWFGILLMFTILYIITATAGLPIGNAAHLGGLVVGLAYGFYLRFRYKKKVAVLDRYFRFRR